MNDIDIEDDWSGWDVPTASRMLASTRELTEAHFTLQKTADDILRLVRDFLEEEES